MMNLNVRFQAGEFGYVVLSYERQIVAVVHETQTCDSHTTTRNAADLQFVDFSSLGLK